MSLKGTTASKLGPDLVTMLIAHLLPDKHSCDICRNWGYATEFVLIASTATPGCSKGPFLASVRPKCILPSQAVLAILASYLKPVNMDALPFSPKGRVKPKLKI